LPRDAGERTARISLGPLPIAVAIDGEEQCTIALVGIAANSRFVSSWVRKEMVVFRATGSGMRLYGAKNSRF